MRDNAGPHVTNSVREYMDKTGIRSMDCLAWSPDLNPIRHIWDELGWSVRNGPIELRNGLVQGWNDMDQNVVKNLIRSMPEAKTKFFFTIITKSPSSLLPEED